MSVRSRRPRSDSSTDRLEPSETKILSEDTPPTELIFPEYISHCESFAGEFVGEPGSFDVERPKPATSPDLPRPLVEASNGRSQRAIGFALAIAGGFAFGLLSARLLPRNQTARIASNRKLSSAPAVASLPMPGLVTIPTLAAMPTAEASGIGKEQPTADASSQAPSNPPPAAPALEPVVVEAEKPEPRWVSKPARLDARVRQALARSAYPDVGVSAGRDGDVYLAGEVFNDREAVQIVRVAARVRGVRHAYFLHPNRRDSSGPAYLGATAAFAPEVWGARVASVSIGSPAAKAGVREGDVIREFDRHTIADGTDLNRTVSEYSPGERVRLRIWRDGAQRFALVRLGEMTTVAGK